MSFSRFFKYCDQIFCCCCSEPSETENKNYSTMDDNDVTVSFNIPNNIRSNTRDYSLSGDDITYNQIYR